MRCASPLRLFGRQGFIPHSPEPPEGVCRSGREFTGRVAVYLPLAEETRALGRLLGRHRAGDVITLRGDLGAGKTTLVQGLAQGLEVTGLVVSPSFTLIHEHEGRVKLYHLDLYRLATAELPDIGVDDILGAEAVVAVEWSERLPASLQVEALEIELKYADAEEARALVLRARGPAAGDCWRRYVLTLALETATDRASVVLWEEGVELAAWRETTHQDLLRRLAGEAGRVMEEAGREFSCLDLLCVGLGPGSFTSLRVGLATAKGFSLAYGTPLVGVGSLAAMAWQLRGRVAGLACPSSTPGAASCTPACSARKRAA